MKKNTILFFSLLAMAACGNKKTKDQLEQITTNGQQISLTTAQMENAGIGFCRVEQKNMASNIKVNGKIDVPPQNMVSVSTPLGGYLKSIKLLPGMHIEKGAAIAVVEDQQFIQLQQDYLLTQSKITFGKLEFERQKALNQSKSGSDKVFQQATADLELLKIMLGGLSEKLKLIGIDPSTVNPNSLSRSIHIYSPIDGYVSKVNVNIGKYVSPTDVLFELINPTDIHLALQVYEKDVDKLFVGQSLEAYTNNDPTKKYHCRIILIGKDLGADRSTEVHCHFETEDRKLLPGTYMNAEINLNLSPTLALPEDAVVRFENKFYLFIKQIANRFEMVEVTTGKTENGHTEILKGETLADKTIVCKGAYTLLMALKNKSEE